MLKGNTAKKVERAGNVIRKTVVGVIIHPIFENMVFTLLEGGEIHVFDVSIGQLVNKGVASVKINSNWALDTVNLRILVVGDVGRATLFDCSMGAFTAKKKDG